MWQLDLTKEILTIYFHQRFFSDISSSLDPRFQNGGGGLSRYDVKKWIPIILNPGRRENLSLIEINDKCFR